MKHHQLTIKTNKAANNLLVLAKKLGIKVGAFDTETTGLHIILDTPFLFQFGFIHPKTGDIYTYVVDLEKQPDLATQVIKVWHNYAKDFDIYLAHNTKYDLHMLANKGLKYDSQNLSDTQFYIRHAHDAVAVKNGGPILKLKDYCARYIDREAKYHEKLLAQERTAIAKGYNRELAKALKAVDKTYTLAKVDELFKDVTFEVDDLPDNIKEVYSNWFNNLPDYLKEKVTVRVESEFIPYNILNRDNIIKYGHLDIYYTLLVYLHTKDVVANRGTQNAINIENALILPLFEMERTGFATDLPYLELSRKRMKKYIKERRKTFYTLIQEDIKIGRHAKIKQSFQKVFDIPILSTNADELSTLRSNLVRMKENPKAIECIDVLQELRTLEKWYSTYIMRMIKNLTHTDRLYTQINQVGTVSGRVSSDFQQFPKNAITTIDGEELFHPRRMIKVTGDDVRGICFIDYSQIELRLQAFYTILVGRADLNLCRAYMPFKCVDPEGKEFDHTSIHDIRRWSEHWTLREAPDTKWEPTDVHGATTQHATGLMPGDPGYKEARGAVGKRTNFAKNYGAKLQKIKQMFPEKSDEEAERIDNAYYLAFPGVLAYHEYCYLRAKTSAWTANLFGIRYYNVNGHNLINTLVQGSAAYLLKLKIIELYDYAKEKGIKSRLQMNIHDEISWEMNKDDPLETFFSFQKIMETWEDTMVPIVAEMEVTKTTWADKKEMNTLDELQVYFGD